MLDCLCNTALVEEEQQLLISRFCENARDAKTVADRKGLKPFQYWANKGSEEYVTFDRHAVLYKQCLA
jgi:hypothetical protein